MRQYKAAIVADGQTMSRELARQQQAENTALAAQQKADAGWDEVWSSSVSLLS